MSKSSIALMVSALALLFIGKSVADSFRNGTFRNSLFAFDMLDDTPPRGFQVDQDTSKKKNPNDRQGDATRQPYVSPLFLPNPSNFKTTFELEEDLSGYSIYERAGKVDVRGPSYITFDDYLKYRKENGIADYYKQQSLVESGEKRDGLVPTFELGEISDIFGGGTVEIRPNGFATLNFSLDRNRTDNPTMPLRTQRVTTFNFDQQIQLGVTGKIGNLMNLNVNFDTKATFDFENQLALKWKGQEDQILQAVEAGNVTLPLGNTLIQGRQNLFGLKTALKFGPVNITAVASTERGQASQICSQGGKGVQTPYEVEVARYDEYRHYFLGHYFRSRYEPAMANLPQVNSTVRINRIEVWINNARGATTANNRSALGFVDLGENERTSRDGGKGRLFNNIHTQNTGITLLDNDANDLYDKLQANPAIRDYRTAPGALTNEGLVEGLDYERVTNMKKLEQNEFNFDPQLGYISLNQKMVANQVLFVAFEYTLNGQVYQVGEFSQDVPSNGSCTNVLFLKMLKPASVKPIYLDPAGEERFYPAWDLMMKNIYNVGYGINQEGFFLDILYNSGSSDGKINYFPTGPLSNRLFLQTSELDRLTNNTAPNPDNIFDYIAGRTIIPDRGLVVFPVLEPFGDYLRRQLGNDQEAIRKYVFDPLYDGTQVDAIQLFPQLNKYTLEGYYSSAGGKDILLNTFNLQEGSVTVTANGQPLQEGRDYITDNFGGKITILREDLLVTNQEICVSYESASLYNVQSKSLLGGRAEYSPFESLNLGLTLLNLSQRPFTQKNNIGDEPFSNTLWGIDAAYRTESEWLTKMVDKLPLISTKQTSTFQGNLEFAQFRPGLPRQIQTDRDDSNIYLDDFEASKTTFLLQGLNTWKLAAFPENNPEVLDPSLTDMNEPLAKNFTRAKLAWYQIDQSFYFGTSFGGAGRPQIPDGDNRSNYTRQILPNEIFQQRSVPIGSGGQLTFDLFYIPDERGPYNYSTHVDPQSGKLLNPKDNWAGITRPISVNNDFEATNVEFLEFWMMDPFLDEPGHTGGKVMLNLGRVSEDILPDNSISLENGLPRSAQDTAIIDSTPWGRVPVCLPPNQTFSNNPDERIFQDVGLDGLSNANERSYFQFSFLMQMENILGANNPAYLALVEDPSSDDFIHFRDADYDVTTEGILKRYTKFNGLEGNSPPGQNAQSNGFVQIGSQEPDTEDINKNGNLSTSEEYFQYEIDLRPNRMLPGQNYIVDSVQSFTEINNVTIPVTWFQFRIPLAGPQAEAINNISNLKAVDFVRMFLTGFEDSVVLRMTEFQLVSTQWRTFKDKVALQDACPIIGPAGADTKFEIGSVSLEENSSKTPFNYILPPAIERQQLNGGTAGFVQNERSLAMVVQDLMPGDARGVFKTVSFDLRNFKRLKLWIHAEAIGDPFQANVVDSGDATVFIRMGIDNTENYYEYEMPITPSDPLGSPAMVTNVWPLSNELNMEIGLLAIAKAARNRDGFNRLDPYYYTDDLPPGHRITVVGTPNIGDVRNIMIGVRNPRPCDPFNPDDNIDIEVWLNELRVTNFDATPGWAARSNVSLSLADFAQIQGSISNKTPGFGGLDQKVSERSQENTLRYDVAGNFTLSKFFPTDWGVNLPLYVTYGEQRITPRYNPREPDILAKPLLESISDREVRDSVRQEFQDFTQNKSISLNNVRIGGAGGGGVGGGGGRGGKGGGLPGAGQQPGGKGGEGKGGGSGVPMPWSLSNFDFTYAYSDYFHRSAFIERLSRTNHRFTVNYRYNFQPVNIEPFKRWKRKNPLSTFNFNPVPSSFSMTLDGNRDFEERKMRAGSTFGGNIDPTFFKNFMLNRTYNLTWNMTKSLNLNLSATNMSRIDEVRGYWTNADSLERDSVGSVWENLLHVGRDVEKNHQNLINVGRNINYSHRIALSYQLPFSKYEWTNFISGNINYASSFTWDQAPENNPTLGATIANTQTIQATGRFDLKNLYKKVGPIDQMMQSIEKRERERERIRRQKERDRERSKQGEDTRPVPTRPTPPVEQDSSRLKILKNIAQEIGRIVFSVKDVSISLNQQSNTLLPGYMPQSDNLGLDFRYDHPYDTAFDGSLLIPPTMGFVFGSQKDIRQEAAEQGWITRDTTLSNFFAQNLNQQISARTSVELFKGFRVDLDVQRQKTENFSELFRWDPDSLMYLSSDALINGSFTMSYLFVNTAFEKNEDISQAFLDFSESRKAISRRLGDRNPYVDSLGLDNVAYKNGYSSQHQDVLLPSLLAAYSVLDSSKVSLNAFPAIPLPNWNVNYNALNNLPFLKRYLNSLTLRHTYRGTYSVNSYTNNLNADIDRYGIVSNTEEKKDINGNSFQDFFPSNNIEIVRIREDFAPFVGLQMNFKNGMTGSVDYKKGRDLAFSTGTMQLTETRREDIAVTLGYRVDKLNWKFRFLGKDFDLQNSANAQFRLTIGDSQTRNRTLDSNQPQIPTQGSFNLVVEPTIDYVLNQRVNLQLFFKTNVTKPYTSNTFRTGFTSGGFKLRFTLN